MSYYGWELGEYTSEEELTYYLDWFSVGEKRRQQIIDRYRAIHAGEQESAQRSHQLSPRDRLGQGS